MTQPKLSGGVPAEEVISYLEKEGTKVFFIDPFLQKVSIAFNADAFKSQPEHFKWLQTKGVTFYTTLEKG